MPTLKPSISVLFMGLLFTLHSIGGKTVEASCTADELRQLVERNLAVESDFVQFANSGDAALEGRRVRVRAGSRVSIPQSEIDDLILSAAAEDTTRVLLNPANPAEVWIRRSGTDQYYRLERKLESVPGAGGSAQTERTYTVLGTRSDVPDAVRSAYPEVFNAGRRAESARSSYNSEELLRFVSERGSNLPSSEFTLPITRGPPNSTGATSEIRIRFSDPAGFRAHPHSQSGVTALGQGFARARGQSGIKWIEGNMYELKLTGREGDTRWLICLRDGVYVVGRAFDHGSADRLFQSRPCD
jgi:hypothetical protein